MDLRTEVAQKEDGRGVGTEEDGANESFIVFHHVGAAAWSQSGGSMGDIGRDLRLVLAIQLDDDEVGDIWEVVCIAEPKVSRASASHGPVGEFCGGVGEDGVPPFKEKRRVAARRNGIVAGSVAGRYWEMVRGSWGRKLWKRYLIRRGC